MSTAIGSSRGSNPSRRICRKRVVPLDHVAYVVRINSLKKQIMLTRCVVSFGLFEAMSAIEMMDPKMDAGMAGKQAKRQVIVKDAKKYFLILTYLINPALNHCMIFVS